jgi:hypothetical protein
MILELWNIKLIKYYKEQHLELAMGKQKLEDFSYFRAKRMKFKTKDIDVEI